MLPKGKAIRYGAILGEDAQAWSGVTTVSRKADGKDTLYRVHGTNQPGWIGHAILVDPDDQ